MSLVEELQGRIAALENGWNATLACTSPGRPTDTGTADGVHVAQKAEPSTRHTISEVALIQDSLVLEKCFSCLLVFWFCFIMCCVFAHAWIMFFIC